MLQLERLDGVPGNLADDVELALQRVGHGDPGAAADENLANHRLDLFYGLAQTRIVAGHVAPAEQHLALVLDRAFDFILACQPRGRFLRQEDHAHAVLAVRRQLDAPASHFLAKELVGDLDQNPGSVAGQRIRADRPAMGKILEDKQALLDDRMAADTLDVRNEPHATGIMFVGRIVEALLRG